jgi:hypothetical protein
MKRIPVNNQGNCPCAWVLEFVAERGFLGSLMELFMNEPHAHPIIQQGNYIVDT